MIFFLSIFLLWSVALFFIIASAFTGFLRTRVPFVPTTDADVELLVRQLPITRHNTVIDLGSGDGRVLFLIEQLAGATVVGYELTVWTHWWALLKKYFKKSHAKLYRDDFFSASWEEASVIYGYLYPPLMGRVEEKFLAECKPGTYAVIRDFPLPNLQPQRVLSSDHRQISRSDTTMLNKRQKFIILMKSLIPGKLHTTHEFYIYKK